jgi:hypothetical protein
MSGVNRRGHREMGKFYGVFPAKASVFIVIWFESVKAKGLYHYATFSDLKIY